MLSKGGREKKIDTRAKNTSSTSFHEEVTSLLMIVKAVGADGRCALFGAAIILEPITPTADMFIGNRNTNDLNPFLGGHHRVLNVISGHAAHLDLVCVEVLRMNNQWRLESPACSSFPLSTSW